MTIYALKDGALARFFAVLAIFTMIVSLIPMQAFAQEATSTDPTVIKETLIANPGDMDQMNSRFTGPLFNIGDFPNFNGDFCNSIEDFKGYLETVGFDETPHLDFIYGLLCGEDIENLNKVEICHVNQGNGYTFNNVAKDSIEDKHDSHTGGPFNVGDIIPPFDDYAGKNWFEPYITLYNNECDGFGDVKIKKVIVGGSALVTDFNLFVGSTSVTHNVKKEDVPVGVYQITETGALANYTASFSGPDCDSAGKITVKGKGTAQCTITNTYTEPTTPTTLKVHIYKHLKTGETTTQVADNAGIPSFPMTATWNATNIGGGTGNYVLGNQHGGAAFLYAADTSAMSAPADYTTSEVTGGAVLASDAQCVPGKYKLVGYKDGATLGAAQADAISLTAPAYTDLASDMHVIVVNELCTETPQEEPICEIGTNLIENGSFEDPEVLNDTWEVYPSGTSGLDWIVSWIGSFIGAPATANLELQENVEGWDAEDGDQYAELDTDWDANVSGEQASAKIAQNIVTEPGATYEIRYSFSARPNTGLADNDLDVLIENVIADSQSADGTTLTNTSWTTYEKEFVASDASTEIAFADAGTANSVGTLLDNVVVCKVKDAPVCVDELQGSWADDADQGAFALTQGNRKNGTDVLAGRSNVVDALGASDWNSGDSDGFISLGFAGSVIVSFDSFVPNVLGTDLKIHEATNGTYPAETANVFVSQDGSAWLLAGVANNATPSKITDIDFDATGLSWIKFVKLVDTSNPALHAADADGFDLDAVEVMQQVCEAPEEPEMCTLTIVSNADDQVGAGDAVLVTFFHDAWDAVVTGASWIWSDNPVVDPVGETNKTFTKSFNWSGDEADIVSATLTIAADNSYDAQINSTSAASSTVENNFGASTVHDVTDLIETGSNTIEVDVKNWALAGGTTETNPAGLLYKLEIVGENANCEEDDDSDDDPTPDETVSSELIVVDPTDMKGWEFNSDRNTWTMGVGEMVSGPATAPLGLGSARLTTPNAADRTKLRHYLPAGVQVSDIKTLKYSTYRTEPTGGVLAPALQFDVDMDGTPVDPAKADARIVFEPYYTQATSDDVWQEWDAIADVSTGNWWIAGPNGGANCTIGNPCTWTELNTEYPDLQISAESLENTIDTEGAMLFKAGGSWAGFDGNVDKFVIAIKTGLNTHTTTYDFEPATPTVSSELIVVNPIDMKGWAFVQETPTGTGAMVSGPAVPVIGSGSAELTVNSAGGELLGSSYAGTLLSKIKALKYSTYRTAGDPALAASLQLNIDADTTDANLAWQGRLVYEPYYTQTVTTGAWQTWDTQDDAAGTGTGNWWFSNGTLATNTGCTQANPCTWAEVKTALPNGGIHATLGGVGFKAGSNWASGFTGNVDKFVIAVETGFNTHTKTFDFEPVITEGEFTLTITTSGEGEGMITGAGINCDTDVNDSDCSQTYPANTVVALTVTPDEGSNFDNSWSVGAGTCVGNATPCSVTMTSNIPLTAHFDLDEDDDSSSTNRSGGGSRVSLTDNGDEDEDSDSDLPEGRVLGEQTSLLPVGAPNTGAGGTSAQEHSTASLVALLAAFFAAVLTRKMQNN